MKNKETNILIFSNVFREIINIFSGPFLTAYFFKISKNSLIDLSTYNIFVFLCVGFFGLMLGYIIRNKFQIGMFRIGVILNAVYVLTIIIKRANIKLFTLYCVFIWYFNDNIFLPI